MIITRLKRLWKLSELDILEVGQKPSVGDQVLALLKKKKMAIIINPNDPLDEVELDEDI